MLLALISAFNHIAKYCDNMPHRLPQSLPVSFKAFKQAPV